MAGGTWSAENKVRPGAYITFESVPTPTSMVGTRGIMTMPTVMSWGPEKELIKLYSTDLLDGGSLPKIGLTAFDQESLLFREALSFAYLGLIYRINAGGEKAKTTLGRLTVTARYSGVIGNRITVAIVPNTADDSLFDVVTYLSGSERDRQTVPASGEGLADNGYVDFDIADPPENSPVGVILAASAGVALTGGTDGTVLPADYADYLDAVDRELWNTMAVPSSDSAIKANIVTYIRNKRDNTGRKCQAVLVGYPNADFEGVISVDQGYVNLASEEVTPEIFTATIAGLTAASTINQSNTFRQFTNAAAIINPIKDQDVEAALKAGKLVLTMRQDGGIVIEQDINTLHSFTPTHDYQFSKNRVIRVLDDIGNQVLAIFEGAYAGKVDNNAQGRSVFRAAIISYMNELQGMGALRDFDPKTDVTVSQGKDISAVVCDLAVKPVDSMEKLYMRVLVGGES